MVTLLPVTSIAPLIELENWFKESILVDNELDNVLTDELNELDTLSIVVYKSSIDADTELDKALIDDDNELDNINVVLSNEDEKSETLPIPWIHTPSDGFVKFSILLIEPVSV